jgi:hypothetical protein
MAVKEITIKEHGKLLDSDGDLVIWIDVPDDTVMLSVDRHYRIADTDHKPDVSGVDLRVCKAAEISTYDVYMKLHSQYQAVGEEEAFELAMADIEHRHGMDIVRHEIIKVEK